MQTHQLKRNNPNMKRVIVARGGKRGKTAGRGGKGQSARAGNKRRPEWRDIIKRLPKLRGRGISPQKSFVAKPVIINLEALEVAFVANDQVSPTTLIEKGLASTISGRVPAIKILGDGEVTKALKLSGLSISGSAKEKIIKAGGTVVEIVPKVISKPEKVKKVKSEKKEVVKEEGDKSEKSKDSKKEAKPAKKEQVVEKVAKIEKKVAKEDTKK
ncbi:MAG: uL15 family ribosomal protein [Candidatus Taylorbacteria bacterium]